jgi:TfoX/Sxy family transcriptional regulator of competence genes
MKTGYNKDLEYRIDQLIRRLGEITKKKMFGGIGYLINGNMCFGIHKESLILRVSINKAEELMKSEDITPFDITGRPMKGWVMVSPDYVETNEQLLELLKLGADYAHMLPAK